MKETLNTVKGRSMSTPVAPALSDAAFNTLFTGDPSAYRYMAETISKKDSETPELAAVCHTDGTI
jgi:predicted NodU family carbamoyl transferase